MAPVAPLEAARIDVVHPQLRGRAESARTVARVVAQAAAPLLFGILSDQLAGGGADGLRAAFLVYLSLLAVSSLLLVLAGARIPSEVASVQESVVEERDRVAILRFEKFGAGNRYTEPHARRWARRSGADNRGATMTAIGGIGASAPGARSGGAVRRLERRVTSAPSSSPAWSVFVALAGVFVALGFAITGPLHAPVGHWDATVARWFFEERTSGGNSWSAAATWLAETPVVVGLGAVTALVLAYRRHWHDGRRLSSAACWSRSAST